MPYGDVNPATGDDPILPSKYWPEDPDGKNPYGSAKERFFNQIKPGMLDAFQFRVVPDDDPRGCFKGSGAAGMFFVAATCRGRRLRLQLDVGVSSSRAMCR